MRGCFAALMPILNVVSTPFAFFELPRCAGLQEERQHEGHDQGHAGHDPQPVTAGRDRIDAHVLEAHRHVLHQRNQHDKAKAVEDETRRDHLRPAFLDRIVVGHGRQHDDVAGTTRREKDPEEVQHHDGAGQRIDDVGESHQHESTGVDRLAAPFVRQCAERPEDRQQHDFLDDRQVPGNRALLVQRHAENLGQHIGLTRVDEAHRRDTEERRKEQREQMLGPDAGVHDQRAEFQSLGFVAGSGSRVCGAHAFTIR